MKKEPLRARKLLTLDLMLLALAILASRTALLVHELGGHALLAWIFGAQRITVRLSALGGGYVDWDREFHGWRGGVTSLGGIFLNLATGALAWAFSRRPGRSPAASAFLLIFGAGSVAGAVVYLANGFYYGSGDPVGFAPDTGDLSHAQWVWGLFLPGALAVGALASRHFAEFLSSQGPLGGWRARLGGWLRTAGVAGLAYALLWLALRQPEKEGSTRQWRIEREVALETERRAAAAPPPPLPAHDRPAPRPVPVVPPPPVRAEEVASRIPSPAGPIVLAATFALGGLLGLRGRLKENPVADVPPAVSGGLALLAAAVVFLFRVLV